MREILSYDIGCKQALPIFEELVKAGQEPVGEDGDGVGASPGGVVGTPRTAPDTPPVKPQSALLLDTCSLLQPAQFFVRKRSSEKSEVLVTVSVLEAKSCGAETVPELVTSPHTTLPVDTPPLVAVKVQSRLSQSSGPAEAAPVMVSVAPVSAPVAEARRGRCARQRSRRWPCC